MSGSVMFDGQSLDGAVFQNCAMARSRFEDVRLSDARYADVDLRRASFRNVNLADVSIDDANIAGLTIRGYDVEALIRHFEATAPVRGSRLLASEPQIFVSDLGAACAYYVGKLGFDIIFSYGEPAHYAQVARGGWCLNLRSVEGPVYDSGFRGREADALSATLTADDARGLFGEFQAAGADFHQPLKAETWGALTFILRDPDGNLIAVAGRAG